MAQTMALTEEELVRLMGIIRYSCTMPMTGGTCLWGDHVTTGIPLVDSLSMALACMPYFSETFLDIVFLDNSLFLRRVMINRSAPKRVNAVIDINDWKRAMDDDFVRYIDLALVTVPAFLLLVYLFDAMI